ncbi:hypothetical protein Tco_0757188 [Tanacetum coccineum]
MLTCRRTSQVRSHHQNFREAGDEGPSSGGTKLSSTFITAEPRTLLKVMLLTYGSRAWNKGEQRSRRRTYNGIYSLFYKDINLSLKDKDPSFLIRQNREKESKAKKLMIKKMQAITRAKSNSIHGSIQAM